MKKIMLFTIILATKACAYSPDVVRSMTYGARVKTFLQILDQDGTPVPNAFVSVGFLEQYNKQTKLKGMTSDKGVFCMEGECTSMVGCSVAKEGFYGHRFMWQYPRPNTDPPTADGKWQPYGATNVVILKKILTPVQMSHPEIVFHRPFPLDKWHGYDLETNEWLPPWGNGSHSDMLVKLTLYATNQINDFRATMEVCFTNNPFGGVVFAKKDVESEMKSTYMANTNDVYAQQASFIYERHFKQKVDTRMDKDTYCIFRTRTTLDEKGNLKTAHYGKIYGPWLFFGDMAADVFFNPTENDPNLEDAETARLASVSFGNFMESYVEE